MTDTRPPTPDAPTDGEDDGERPGRPWWHWLAFGLALGVLGFGIGLVAAQDRPPGDSSVDVGFLRDMRAHHDQAVQMALAYIAKGPSAIDPQLRVLAYEIVRGQQLENGQMVEILRTWGRAEIGPTDDVMGWMGMALPLDEMPGLATAAQMAALDHATGPEADRLFATLMRAHHVGGVHMAEYAASHAQSGRVRHFAGAMAEAQRGEIVEIDRVLARLG